MPFNTVKACESIERPSLSLLATVPPSFTATVRNKCMINPTRILQLRSDTILLFNKQPQPDLSNAVQVISINPDQLPLRRSTKTVVLEPHTFSFFSSIDAKAFRLALLTIITRLSYSQSRPSFEHSPVSSLSSGNASHFLDSSSSSASSYTSSTSSSASSSSLSSRPQLLSVKKIAKDDAFFSSTSLTRVVQERIALELAAKSKSPFISRMRHAYETSEALNIVTEAPELGDLNRLLSKLPKRRLRESTARQVFAEIVLALEDVHNLGLLFRNVNPENIHLTSSGHVRLVDFALAKRVHSDRSSRDSTSSTISSSSSSSSHSDESEQPDVHSVGRTNSFVGKRMYMSPEYLHAGDGSYGSAADIWALGVTLYTMVTGRPPFMPTTNAATLFNRIANDNIRLLSFLSDELKSLIRSLLDKDECSRLTIEEIKNSEWLKEIDWDTVRANASLNLDNEDVLDVVRQSKLDRIDDIIIKSSESFESTVSDSEERPSDSSTRSSESEFTKVSKWARRKESSLACQFKRLTSSSVSKRKICSEGSDYRLLGFNFTLESIE